MSNWNSYLAAMGWSINAGSITYLLTPNLIQQKVVVMFGNDYSPKTFRLFLPTIFCSISVVFFLLILHCIVEGKFELVLP